MVRYSVSKNSRHGAQDGEDPHAEVGYDAQLPHGLLALLELLLGQRQLLGLALAALLGGEDDGDARGDAEQLEAAARRAREPVVRRGRDVADGDARGVALGAGAHGRDDGELVLVAVS